MRAHGSPTELEQRRFRALQMLAQGLEPHVVAERWEWIGGRSGDGSERTAARGRLA